jgi:peptidylprolyl isomerase
MRAAGPVVLLGAVFVLIGCTGGQSSPDDPTMAPQRDLKADVMVPKSPPPKKLVIKDIKDGSGPIARGGDDVTVNWVGFWYRQRREFYGTWKDRHPFTFEVGAGQVIRGWDRSMRGMKVGGRRKVLIPPSLAYGDTGTSSVPPNEPLVYVIDLLAVK